MNEKENIDNDDEYDDIIEGVDTEIKCMYKLNEFVQITETEKQRKEKQLR